MKISSALLSRGETSCARFRSSSDEISNMTLPEPYFALLSRYCYLPKIFAELYAHFKPFILPRFAMGGGNAIGGGAMGPMSPRGMGNSMMGGTGMHGAGGMGIDLGGLAGVGGN